MQSLTALIRGCMHSTCLSYAEAGVVVGPEDGCPATFKHRDSTASKEQEVRRIQHVHYFEAMATSVRACPMPRPELPSVQSTGCPAAAKWAAHASRSRWLTMSTRFSSTSRGLAPHQRATDGCAVDAGMLYAGLTIRVLDT